MKGLCVFLKKTPLHMHTCEKETMNDSELFSSLFLWFNERDGYFCAARCISSASIFLYTL